MPTSTDSEEFLDFKTVKREACIPTVLAWFGVFDELEVKGDELVGRCMLGQDGHGKDNSFGFNLRKQSFNCFACKKRGSILDWVAKRTAKIEGKGCTLQMAADIVESITRNSNPDKRSEAQRIEWARSAYRSRSSSTVHYSNDQAPEEAQTTAPAGIGSSNPWLQNITKGKQFAMHLANHTIMTWEEAENALKEHTIEKESLVVMDANAILFLNGIAQDGKNG